MEEKEYRLVEKFSDAAYGRFKQLLDAGAFAELSKSLQVLTAKLDSRYSVTIDFMVNVCDSKRETSFHALDFGLESSDGEPPRETFGDCAPNRYVVNGTMMMIPEEYCPNCWGGWMGKLEFRTCPDCGFTLGKEVKLLIDSDQCPYCEHGTVTASQPKCPKCNMDFGQGIATWG